MPQALATFSSATFPYVDPLVIKDTNTRGGIMSGSAAAVVKRGQLLELSTTKWIPSTTTPTAILAEDCDATAGDASCIVYIGGHFMASGIIWGALNHATATEALRDVGIQLQTVMVGTGTMVKGAELPSEKVRVDDTAITKDLHPKEIITATGPIPVVQGTEGEPAPPFDPAEPHPAPLRVQPGETEPPVEKDKDKPEHAEKRHHVPPQPQPRDAGGNKK